MAIDLKLPCLEEDCFTMEMLCNAERIVRAVSHDTC